ncbi:hypothetical protein SteCoe_8084 [Stentor coeruleus]|uniref:Potassium channel domain-containing protein n=1 Tax=Stentor coeruleus TaxID=5963 RepID=A0A1R2CL29_9CILI|nr:hypothetical protein SteCoe_8084 [Stentor coeruleus]
MIPAIQRQDRKHGTVKKHTSLASLSTFPKPIRQVLKLKKSIKTTSHKTLENDQLGIWLLLVSSLLSVFNITLVFYESELIYESDYKINDKINALRAVIFVSCLAHSLVIIKYYIHKDPSPRLKEWISKVLHSKKQLLKIILDISIAMLHTPPGLSSNLTFTQLGFQSTLSYTDIIFPFCLLKSKFILTFLSEISKYNNKKAKFILNWLKINNNTAFMIKSYIKETPFKTATFCFGISILLIGMNLRIFEKASSSFTLWDSFWLCFLTESTIGYGDIYPKTHIGRLISGFAGIIGVFIFSYNVVAVRDIIDLNDQELHLCKRLRHNFSVSNQLKPKSASFIQKWWRAKKSKSIKEHFSVIAEAKRFSFLRKFLSKDIASSVQEQITDTEKVTEKAFKRIKNDLENAEKYAGLAHRLMKMEYGNMKKLRVLNGLYGSCEEHKLSVNQGKYLNKDSSSIMKMRNQAVKNLFIRRVGVSPNMSASPSFSFVDLE